jgi:cytochrome c peroxidase
VADASTTRLLGRAPLLALLLLGACQGHGAPGQPPESPDSPDAALDQEPDASDTPTADASADVAPSAEALSPDVLTALRALRYDPGPPPPDPSNRYGDDPAARELGRLLFFDPSLSGKLLEGDNDGSVATLGVRGEAGRVSCAGCHIPGSHFVDTRSPHRQISLASGWTQRRTPTLLEVAFAPLYNWDGRRDSIWAQALGVMENDKEFNSGRLFVAQQIFRQQRARYEAVFGALPPLDDTARFPALSAEQAGCDQRMTREGVVLTCRGKPGDGAEYDGLSAEDQAQVTRVAVNVAKAMAAYVRALRCGPSRFDAWLDGDVEALDAHEQLGAALFVGRGKCVSCHAGPRLSDGRFHNIGLAPATVAVAFTDSNDRGAAEGVSEALRDPLNTRGPFSDGDRNALPSTVTPELLGAFRTPGLRCIAKQPSFMHTGQLRTLGQVVAFHARGGDRGGYPGMSELTPLDLSADEQAALAAFIAALDGPGPEPKLLTP